MQLSAYCAYENIRKACICAVRAIRQDEVTGQPEKSERRACTPETSEHQHKRLARRLWSEADAGEHHPLFLTQELDSISKNGTDIKLVYYFCNHQLRSTTAIDVLRTVLWQILRDEVAGAISLYEKYFKNDVTTTLMSFVSLWAMLEDLLAQRLRCRHIYLVLDGLDECDKQSAHELSQKLAAMPSLAQDSPHTDFHAIIISRDTVRLRSLPRIKLDLDHDQEVSRDIQIFVTARVAELSILDGYTDSFHQELEHTLIKKAEGTFLWIGFAMSEIGQEQTCSAVLRVARSFPAGLTGFYSRMLLQVDRRRQSDVARILQWVCLAKRPLRVVEMADVLAVDAERGMAREQLVRDAVVECRPMLRITRPETFFDVHLRQYVSAEIVSFIH
ncbi:Putative P-loop containing nucleoside triphosphate hydrolase [Septoria linicola]|uniref:P-loop containing nucleoside triphosphate hydrolase n=1 Tax=Septoria linicola TaxID=215465 RepID=A0A9Q9EFB6_9PEZI|nr:putative P-loop containing nucleoside triphosphate hydrolase [Septoria linicola]USW47043.1 Putative P-loop containing nucleoside triphosphate hydrolase [Septoria linicola]